MLLPEFSRTQLVDWVRDGSLTMDGRVVPAKQRVFGGEALVLNADIARRKRVGTFRKRCRFGVCSKTKRCCRRQTGGRRRASRRRQSGSHAGERFAADSSAHRPQLPRAGIVHRLDKDTSGLLSWSRKSTAALRAADRGRSRATM